MSKKPFHKKPFQGKHQAQSKSEPIAKFPMRLNKYIANSGVCSRREADKLIEAGEVNVNGKVITEMGYQVDSKDVVKYQGQKLVPEKLVYILLNKPKGFISTTSDPEGRRTVMELIKNACDEQVFPVGRLDRATTGLLLFTNDGEMAKKLTHPSSKVKKIYQVTLDKPLTKNDYLKIVEGFELEDGPVKIDELAILDKEALTLGIEIHIGRNRIVRRTFEHLGYKVEKLDRAVFAGLTKKDLPRGKWRILNEKEVRWVK